MSERSDDLWQQAQDAQRAGDEAMTERLQDEAREAERADDGVEFTASGRRITKEMFEALADEAEAGYDVDEILARRAKGTEN